MNIKLKCIKDYPDMSEETNCFQADIWVGNKRVAHVKNSGTGGCDNVYPYEGMRPLLNEIKEYCKTLPKIEGVFPDGRPYSLDSDLEMVVEGLLNDWRDNKSYKKAIVWKKADGGKYLTTWKGTTLAKLLKSPTGINQVKRAVARIQMGGGTVLNTNLEGIL